MSLSAWDSVLRSQKNPSVKIRLQRFGRVLLLVSFSLQCRFLRFLYASAHYSGDATGVASTIRVRKVVVFVGLKSFTTGLRKRKLLTKILKMFGRGQCQGTMYEGTATQIHMSVYRPLVHFATRYPEG
ncbi:hypothetical protein BDZ94DRAFT_910891 [Collybia nuda]|uniref:Uncharacterized protein n=1 Tax=Collybia nuda TaxID=64659 RepID=A0A9P5YHD6_9AGAR|nr:hypothetical protein BDZ94DRAFT_910891 [Collybia nuda]